MAIIRVSGQSIGTSDPGYNTIVITYPNNVTVGNLLVFGVASYYTSASLSNISMTSGTATLGTITLDGYYQNSSYSSGEQGVSIFSAPVTGTGSCVISLNQATNGLYYSSLALQEYTGVDVSSSRVFGTSTGTGTSLSPSTSNITSPSQGGAFVGGLAYNEEGTFTISTGTNFSNIYNTVDTQYLPCAFEDYLVSSSISSPANWTITGGSSEPYAALVVGYKASGTSTTYTTPYINVGGTWNTVINAWVYTGGSWKIAQNCETNNSGTWS